MQLGSVAARPHEMEARASATTLCISCGPIKCAGRWCGVQTHVALQCAPKTRTSHFHEKNKNMLHVDCGAAYVCPEHWMETGVESDMRPLTLGAAGQSTESAFRAKPSDFEYGRFHWNWSCLCSFKRQTITGPSLVSVGKSWRADCRN